MNSVLISFAVFFLAVIVGYFVWGVGYIVMQVGAANNGKAGSDQVPAFDLKNAASIDYRGIPVQLPSSGS